MADTVTYEIHIVQDGGESQKSAPKAVASAPDGQPTLKVSALEKKIGKMASFAFAMQAANKIIAPQISRIEIKTGHATLQQRQQFVYNNLKLGASSVASIVGGFAVGGIPGAAVAAVGVGLNLINRIGDMITTDITLSKAQTVESFSIRQSDLRSGTGGDRIGKNYA